MSIITNTLIGDNLNFAIANMTATLTAVTPTNTETYSANKQDVVIGFNIFEDGREQTADTRFYLNRSSYTTLPSRGMILTDGTRNYKVLETHTDVANVTLKIDCASSLQTVS